MVYGLCETTTEAEVVAKFFLASVDIDVGGGPTPAGGESSSHHPCCAAV